jgi:hypothetical protein
MRPLLPAKVVDRGDKQGFTVDQQAWLAGPLGELLRATFASERMAARPYFDAGALPAALLQGGADAVWRSFMVERWLRLFVDPPVLRAPAADLSADLASF